MATIVKETGAIIAGANSYITEAELTTYAADRGLTLTGVPAVLLIQAMDYIESLEYKGWQVSKDQPLSWPRYGVSLSEEESYYYCNCIDSDEIPQLLKDGLAETAIAIDTDESPIASIEPAIKRIKVDVIETEYKNGASSTTYNKKIPLKLKKLLKNYGIPFRSVKG